MTQRATFVLDLDRPIGDRGASDSVSIHDLPHAVLQGLAAKHDARERQRMVQADAELAQRREAAAARRAKRAAEDRAIEAAAQLRGRKYVQRTLGIHVGKLCAEIKETGLLPEWYENAVGVYWFVESDEEHRFDELSFCPAYPCDMMLEGLAEMGRLPAEVERVVVRLEIDGTRRDIEPEAFNDITEFLGMYYDFTRVEQPAFESVMASYEYE